MSQPHYGGAPPQQQPQQQQQHQQHQHQHQPQQQQQQQQQYYAGAPQPTVVQVPYAAAAYGGAPPAGYANAPYYTHPLQQQQQQQQYYAQPPPQWSVGAQQVQPTPVVYGGGAHVGAGGVSVLTPEQQAAVNDASWHDASNWYMCESRYYGRYDTRFWVPPRRQGGCATSVPNHAHPIYRRLMLALILVIVISQILRYVLVYVR